jgi:hypothetical protein
MKSCRRDHVGGVGYLVEGDIQRMNTLSRAGSVKVHRWPTCRATKVIGRLSENEEGGESTCADQRSSGGNSAHSP